MKKNILPYLTCILFLFAFSSCRQDGPAPIRNVKAGPKLLKAQVSHSFTNYSYISNNQQRFLGNVNTKQVVVSFVNGLTAAQEQAILGRYDFVEKQTTPLATPNGLLHSITLTDGLNCSQVELALAQLAEDPNISYAAPCFLDGERLVGVSDQVNVTMEKEGVAATIEDLAKQFNAEVLASSGSNSFVLKVDKNSKGNALALANFLQTQKGIVRAEPDFVLALNK